MQIACGHDPIWIVVGATQHGRSRFTGLAWQPSAIHWKRISSLEDLQAPLPPWIKGGGKKERNESDKQCKKGGIAFWGSLYSASFKKQYVNRADAEAVIYLGHRQRRHRTLRPRWVTLKMLTLVKYFGKRHTSPPEHCQVIVKVLFFCLFGWAFFVFTCSILLKQRCFWLILN